MFYFSRHPSGTVEWSMNCTSEHCSGFARYITFLKCNWATRAAWLAEEASVYLAGHEHSGVEGGRGTGIHMTKSMVLSSRV